MPNECTRPDADCRVSDAHAFESSFQQFAARIRTGQPVPRYDIKGTDHTGTIRCTLSARGTLVDVTIGPQWWDTLGPTEVAAAVLEAFDYARTKVGMAQMILDRNGHSLPAARRPAPDPVGSGSLDVTSALLAMTRRGYEVLDEVDRITRIREDREPRTVAGPRRLFFVTMVGCTITSAHVTPHGLTASDGARLAADAREALLTAVQPRELAGSTRRDA